jgi:putative transposase
VIVHQAYRFALDPTPAQARALSALRGAARFAFHWGLALVKAVVDQREAEAGHGIAPEGRTPALRWSLPALRRTWIQVKSEVPRVGLPRFKPKRRTRRSCRFTTAPMRVEPDRRHVTLPLLGRIRTREPIVVGADLGSTHLAVLSQPVPRVTDQAGFVANPHHLGRAPAALRRRSRTVSPKRGPDRRTRDGLHKLTPALANEFGTRNRRLARSIAGTGFGEVRRQLAYRTRWRGNRLIVADRWFPSSKTCSHRGVVKAELPLHIRAFRRESCAALLVRSTTGTGQRGRRPGAARLERTWSRPQDPPDVGWWRRNVHPALDEGGQSGPICPSRQRDATTL